MTRRRAVVTAVLALGWPIAASAQTWNLNANGNWGVATNWLPASVPNGVNATATLGNVITANRTITLNLPVTLGTLNFSDNNNYTIAGAGVNNLTFDVSVGNATLNVTSTGANTISRPIVLNDTLVINQGSTGNLTLSGAISGAGGLIKNGTGTLVRSGAAATYTGPTLINAGTLLYNVNGAITAGSAVTIGDGNTLNGNATLTIGASMGAVQALNVTLNADGILIQNNNQFVRLRSASGAGELRLNSAVGNGFEFTGAGASSTFSGLVTGGIAVSSADPAAGSRLIKSGASTQTLSGANTYVARTFINGGSLRAENNSALGVASAGFTNATFVYGTGSLELANNITIGERIYLNGAGNAGTGALRNFAGNNTITGNVTLGWAGGTVAASAVSIGAEAGSTLTINGNLDGPQALTKVGAGTVVLNGNNTWGVSTTVNAGTLLIGSANGMANNLALTVNGGTLDLNGFSRSIVNLTGTGGAIQLGSGTLTTNQTAARTFAGVISGSGALVKTGAATLTLTGANTYSGGTTVSAGALVGNSTSLQGNILNNAAVTFNQAGSGTYAGAMSGNGSLTKSGAGTLILTGANNYSGGTTVSAGILQGNSTSLQGNIVNNATVVFDQAVVGTYAGVMSGSGSLTKANSGTLTLTGVNTYSGVTRINGGTLAVANNSALGSGSLSFSGGTLQTLAAFNSAKNIALLGAGSVDTNGFAAALSGAITGAGGLTKSGAGTLTLTGANSYTGGTIVSGGALQGNTTSLQGNIVNNATVVFNQAAAGTYAGTMSGSGALVKNSGGTLTLTGTHTYSGATAVNAGVLQGNSNSLQGNIVNNAAVVFDQAAAGTYAGAMSGSGSLAKSNSGTLTLTGANSYTGGTTVNGGTLQGNTASLQGNIVNNATVVFDQAATGTYAGALSGTGSVIKANAGDLILTGSSTYSGATSVNAGSLTVLGTLASNVTIASGTSLMGTGAIGGLIASSGSVIAPGNAGGGVLTINGAYTHDAGATLRVVADAGGASNRLDVNGTATLNGGSVDVAAQDGNYSSATRYTIVSANGGLSGTYGDATTNLAFLTPTLTYDPNSVFLTLSRNTIDFATVALTPNQRSVAAALGAAETASPAGDMSTVLTAVSGLSAPQARSAYESIGGLIHTLLPAIGVIDAVQFNRATALRLHERSQGFWVSPYAVNGDIDGDASSGVYDYRIGGLIVGADTEVARGLVIGATAAYGDWKVTNDRRGDHADVQSYRIGGYTRYAAGALRADAVLAYGKVNYETDRRIVFGAINRTASGDYSGDQLTANIVGRYRLAYGSYGIEPFAAVQWIREKQDAFTESGAQSVDLNVAGRTLNSTRGTLGARVDRAFDAAGGQGLLDVRAGYTREFSGAPRIGATLAGDPTQTGIGIAIESWDRNIWVAGAGVSFSPSKNWTLYLDASSEFRSNGNAAALLAGVRATW